MPETVMSQADRIDAIRRSMFPDNGKELREWLDTGWKPGAPPYERVQAVHVWRSALGSTYSASWIQLEAIYRQLVLLGWLKNGSYCYRPTGTRSWRS